MVIEISNFECNIIKFHNFVNEFGNCMFLAPDWTVTALEVIVCEFVYYMYILFSLNKKLVWLGQSPRI